MTQPTVIRSYQLARYCIDLHPALPVGKQRIEQRQGLIVSLTDSEDNQAFAEISPLAGVDRDGQVIHGYSLETLTQTEQALQTLLPNLLNIPSSQLDDIAEQAPFASMRFGLSMLAAKLTSSFNQGLSDSRNVPLVYDGMSAVQVANKVQSAVDHCIKVKVAQTSIDAEIAFIHRILEINPKLRLRLDANRGFDIQQACDFLSCLPKASIDYIEEPCVNPKDNDTVYQSVGVKYALDESLNHPEYQFSPQPGLAALVLKPTLLGTVSSLQQLIQQATEHGVRCILSSSLESDIGITDLRRLSHAITPDEIPGLDTLSPFEARLLLDDQLNLEQLNVIASSNPQ